MPLLTLYYITCLTSLTNVLFSKELPRGGLQLQDETKTRDDRFVPMTELTKRLGKSRAFIYAEAKRNPNFVRLVKLAGRVGD